MTSPLNEESRTLDPRVTSAQLSDSLDSIGIRHQAVGGAVRTLRPGQRVAGAARIVRFEPETRPAETAYLEDNPYDDFIAFMDTVQAGDVIVVATGANPSTAYWGELFSAAALGHGAVGIICDSFTRDRPKIDALGFPVFSTGTRPIDFRARMRITAVQVTVEFEGVTISPGDLVLGDDDGIVVAPAADLDRVIAIANERAATETTVLAELLAGRSIGEVWRQYRTL